MTEGERIYKSLPQYGFLQSNGVAAKKKTHETKLIILLSGFVASSLVNLS